MENWGRSDALAALAAFSLSDSNLEVAQYWASLWDGEKPPLRNSFNPARIVKHLPAIAIFEVRVGESVHCTLAGSLCRLALGFEITGKDLLALTPKAQHKERIHAVSKIAQGAVMRANRSISNDDGEIDVVEEIYLPLAGLSENGTRRYLMHSNWRPRHRDFLAEGLIRTNAAIPDNRAIKSIVATNHRRGGPLHSGSVDLTTFQPKSVS